MTSMKLTKILILVIGLMALSASAAFADAAFNVFASKRNLATNAQTGEVDTVTLVSAFGDAIGDPAFIPEGRSIFFTFSQPITALSDIDFEGQRSGLIGGDLYLDATMTAYGVWYPIRDGSDDQVAEIRVGYNGADPLPKVVQVHFINEDLALWYGDTLKLRGVRVSVVTNPNLGMVEGQEVFVSLSNPEGDIAFDNASNLPVAITHHPIYCDGCDPSVSFRQDGKTYNDTTTVTIGELFTNAFEAPEQIRIDVPTPPTGFDFVGCSGVMGSGSVELSAYVSTCSSAGIGGGYIIVTITSSNESYFETLDVGLIYDLIGIPDFPDDINNSVLTIYKYPDKAGCPYPWYGSGASTCAGSTPLKYAYMPITDCEVEFNVESDIGGELLSVFNVSDEVWDTGIGIMNGSGAEPLKSEYIYGHWWDIPQNGAVEVWMYPMYTYDANDPFGYDSGAPTYSPYTFTTSAATAGLGYGLDLDGRVPNRGTWAVLVSQLCSVAKLDTTMDGMANGTGQLCSASWPTFEGFIIFRTYFPSAEGVNFIADWGGNSTQSHGYAMINLTRREETDKAQKLIDKIYDKVKRGRR
jgi:hypothetical protein